MHALMKIAVVLLLLDFASWAQKVDVGYDKKTDFSHYKTYAWMPQQRPPARPVLAMHIIGSIDEELVKKGLQKTESTPDLLLSCQGGIDPQSAFATHDPTYSAWGGIPPPDATVWGGTMTPVPVSLVQEGMLLVHMVDGKSKQLVWQAKVKVDLDYQHKEKALEQVNKAIAKMFKKYPPDKN